MRLGYQQRRTLAALANIDGPIPSTTADVRRALRAHQAHETAIRDRLYSLEAKGLVSHYRKGQRHQWHATRAGMDAIYGGV